MQITIITNIKVYMMKFYDRTKELALFADIYKKSQQEALTMPTTFPSYRA